MTDAPAGEDAGGVSRPQSPYVGLVPYDEGDAAFFFGRTTEAAIVAANLRSTRLTILYGPSGVGKTSLLMAGSVHRLRKEARAASAAGAERPFGICVYRSWRDDPVQGVQEAARIALQEAAGAKPVPPPASTLAETLRAWTAGTTTLLVVFDQFEEYFQYHPDEGGDERLAGFAAELAEIVNDSTLPVNVLLSLREDAWAKLDRFEGHIPALFANYLRVDHLDLRAARKAIEGPIAAWDRSLPAGEQPYEIEPALVEAVLAATAGGALTLTGETDSLAPDAARDRIEAPFLQLVLDRLWRETTAAGEHTLTLARLEALGGAAKIVENHLRDALGRLTPAEQDTASDCFRFLVTKSKTKVAHPASDLSEWTQQLEPQVTAVLETLCTGESGRILRVDAPAQDGGSASYELFHDILGEPILDWRRGHEVERSRRAARRRFARIGGALLLLVAVFAGLGFMALVQRNHAIEAKERADEFSGVGLGSVASSLRTARLDAALLLGLEAYRRSPTVQVESGLISTLQAARRSGTEAILRSRQGAVNDVAFSPDGQKLATAGSDGTVMLWDARQPHTRRATFKSNQRPALAVAFSPSGQTLATAGFGGTVLLWDTRTPKKPYATLNGNQRAVYAVAFSPDGHTLATAGFGETVLLWDVSVPTRRPTKLETGQVHVLAVAFSLDGRMLATAGQDGTVLLSDTGTPNTPGPRLNGNQGVVSDVAFSPDGQRLATAGDDGTVMLWDARQPHTRRATLNGNRRDITRVAFRDGHTLAAAGRDGTVQFWDTRRPMKPYATVNGHQSIIRGVAFSPDGTSLASAGSDGTVRLWDTRSSNNVGQPLTGPHGRFYAVAFSADGHMLATAGDDGSVRLWNASTNAQLGQLTVSRDPVAAVAFSPDGQTLATGGYDGKVRLWNTRTRDPLPGKALDAGTVHGVAFSPDGQTVATAGDDGKVRLWNARTREPLRGNAMNATERGPVYGVAFSPQTSMLASADQDGKVLFWDPSTHAKLGMLKVSEGALYGVTYTPDGRKLATVGDDGVVRLWDATTHAQFGRGLDTDQEGAYGIAFSPDSRTLAATGYDGPVVLWEGILWRDFAHLKTLVCNLVVGNLTKGEWEALAPGLGYRTTCPS